MLRVSGLRFRTSGVWLWDCRFGCVSEELRNTLSDGFVEWLNTKAEALNRTPSTINAKWVVEAPAEQQCRTKVILPFCALFWFWVSMDLVAL